MNNEYCEKVRISAMAILDGEVPQLPKAQVDEHLEVCAACRQEIEVQRQVVGLLGGYTRPYFGEDVSEVVAARIGEAKAQEDGNKEVAALAVLGVILLAYKIVEVLPGITLGTAVKLMPVIVVLVFFGLLKQNPFTISRNLRFEGDIR